MTRGLGKLALLIDGFNLRSTTRALGFDVDYKRFLEQFESRGTVLRAFYYTVLVADRDYSSARPLVDWLDYNGFTVVTRTVKEFVDGRRSAPATSKRRVTWKGRDQYLSIDR